VKTFKLLEYFMADCNSNCNSVEYQQQHVDCNKWWRGVHSN